MSCTLDVLAIHPGWLLVLLVAGTLCIAAGSYINGRQRGLNEQR